MILAQDPSARPENIQGWATSMRQELLTPHYREKLVDVFKRFGLMTNTHPGFPLGSFGVPADILELQDGHNDLVHLSKEYAEGIAPEMGGLPNLNAYLTNYLEGKGRSPETIQFLLERDRSVFLMAMMERLSKGLRV